MDEMDYTMDADQAERSQNRTPERNQCQPVAPVLSPNANSFTPTRDGHPYDPVHDRASGWPPSGYLAQNGAASYGSGSSWATSAFGAAHGVHGARQLPFHDFSTPASMPGVNSEHPGSFLGPSPFIDHRVYGQYPQLYSSFPGFNSNTAGTSSSSNPAASNATARPSTAQSQTPEWLSPSTTQQQEQQAYAGDRWTRGMRLATAVAGYRPELRSASRTNDPRRQPDVLSATASSSRLTPAEQQSRAAIREGRGEHLDNVERLSDRPDGALGRAASNRLRQLSARSGYHGSRPNGDSESGRSADVYSTNNRPRPWSQASGDSSSHMLHRETDPSTDLWDSDDESYGASAYQTQRAQARSAVFLYGPDHDRFYSTVVRGAMNGKRVPKREYIENLEEVDVEDLKEDDRMCTVCYNDYGVANPEGVTEHALRLPKCKHIFGDKCLKKWFEENDSCPYCRDKLPAERNMRAVYEAMGFLQGGSRGQGATTIAQLRDAGVLPSRSTHASRPTTMDGPGRRPARGRMGTARAVQHSPRSVIPPHQVAHSPNRNSQASGFSLSSDTQFRGPSYPPTQIPGPPPSVVSPPVVVGSNLLSLPASSSRDEDLGRQHGEVDRQQRTAADRRHRHRGTPIVPNANLSYTPGAPLPPPDSFGYSPMESHGGWPR